MASGQRDDVRRAIERVFNQGPVAGLGEGQLLHRFVAQRDPVAFEALLVLHGPMVLGVCRRHLRDPHDVDDAFQATFLVLVRRVNALRGLDQLGPWLHGVAFRVASRARVTAARRRERERDSPAARVESVDPAAGLEGEELRRALDAEIDRLPEKYRRPVVLCYLEGRSHAEAARRLRASEGSVRGRLDRARERLRSRLARRGLAPAAGLPAAWLSTETATAAVPASLLAATASSLAGLVAAGAITTSMARVVSLAERTLHMMTLSKMKAAAAALLATVAVTLVAWVSAATLTQDEDQPPAATAEKKTESQRRTVNAVRAESPQAKAKGRTLEIRVVDRQTGRPIPGVNLRIGIDRKRIDATTDETGRYVITDLPITLNGLVVWAKKPGLVPTVVNWREEALEGRIPSRFTLPMEPGTTIGGGVRDEEGRPIAGATVYLRADCGRGEGAVVTDLFEYPAHTDAQGRWRCDLIPAGSDCVSTRLVHPDFVSDRSYGDTPVPPIARLRDQTAVMVMKRGATLFGTIHNASGKPIAGARVKLGTDRWGSPQPPSTTTDVEGRYQFHVQPGSQVVTVQAGDYAPDLKPVPAIQGRTQVDFQLEPARSLHGLVLDPQGRPIAGARVVADTWRGYRTLEDSRATTDADGRFRWDGAPADEVLVDVVHRAYMPVRRKPLRASDAEIVLTLSPSLRVHGTVVDADTDQPIPAFKVIPGIVISKHEPYWTYDKARPAKDGWYEITFDDTRTPHVRIEAEGYQPAVSRAFREDEGDQVYDFKLRKGTAIAGVVRLPDGSPLAGAEVVLATSSQAPTLNNGRNLQRGRSPSVRTGPDGRFSLPGQEGDYAIVVLHDRGFAERSRRELQADPSVTVRPWGRIEGTLRVGTNPGARESIMGDLTTVRTWTKADANYLFHAEADDDGRFVLERVPPGRMHLGQQLRMARGGFTTGGTSGFIDVAPGQTVHLALGGTGRPVVGRMVRPSGSGVTVDWSYGNAEFRRQVPSPEPPASLTDEEKARWWLESDAALAYRRDSRMFPFNIGPDGSFRVEDVPAGSYLLTVWVGTPPSGNERAGNGTLGRASHTFVVPEMPSWRSDEPLDVGRIELKLE